MGLAVFDSDCHFSPISVWQSVLCSSLWWRACALCFPQEQKESQRNL